MTLNRTYLKVLIGMIYIIPLYAQSTQESPFNIRDLHWLVGSWIDRTEIVYSEEYWIPAKGDMMLGIHRTVTRLGERAFFEFLRIEQVGNQVIYYASPEGHGPTPFRLVSKAHQKAIFENLDHDYPSRIIYWKDKQGYLNARVEGTSEGKPKSEEWRWESLQMPSDQTTINPSSHHD